MKKFPSIRLSRRVLSFPLFIYFFFSLLFSFIYFFFLFIISLPFRFLSRWKTTNVEKGGSVRRIHGKPTIYGISATWNGILIQNEKTKSLAEDIITGRLRVHGRQKIDQKCVALLYISLNEKAALFGPRDEVSRLKRQSVYR